MGVVVIISFVVLYAMAAAVLYRIYQWLIAEKKKFSDQMLMADENMTERYSNFVHEMLALEDKRIAFDKEKSDFEASSAHVNKKLNDQFNSNTKMLQELFTKRQELVNQGTKNQKLLDANNYIFRRNSTTLFHIKETSLKLYDGYENILKTLDGDWTNSDERNRILNDISLHRDLLLSYFINTFAITPDQYRKSKQVISGKHHGKPPFITDSSLN